MAYVLYIDLKYTQTELIKLKEWFENSISYQLADGLLFWELRWCCSQITQNPIEKRHRIAELNREEAMSSIYWHFKESFNSDDIFMHIQ